jgi:hypothetical protein
MGSYKKLTREDIDFPNYCLFFIRCIQEAIDNAELSYTDFLEVNVGSTYPYCSDAFDLITKTFERKGLDIRTPTFKLEMRNNEKYYNYKWKLRKGIDYNDLPF